MRWSIFCSEITGTVPPLSVPSRRRQHPAKIKKKKDRFVSSCDVLDINTQGYTEEEARKNLVEAIRLFFVSCYERGTVDEALRECGVWSSSFAPP